MVKFIALSALVGAASASVIAPAGYAAGVVGAPLIGAPLAFNTAINAGYAHGLGYAAAPIAAAPAYAAAPAIAAAPAYAPAAYAAPALPAIQPVNYALPAPREYQEAPIVEQAVEKVEQHGYSVRY